MPKTVLITGGAGFIGSHLADLLIASGYKVRIYDKLVGQVHSGNAAEFVPKEAELVIGDICDAGKLEQALEGVEMVVHLAAEVGVGQSMYEITRYVGTNTGGTSVLLEILSKKMHRVNRLVVASSMSVYGEGMYRCEVHGEVAPTHRSEAQLSKKQWEVCCPTCGNVVQPVPTQEDKQLNPSSIYAITKLDQELMCLNIGRAYGIQTVALRFFNAYGTRQSLSNPYTGVAAIFSSRLLNNESPIVYEDGLQARDFVHIADLTRGILKALESRDVYDTVINIGSGIPITISEVARVLAKELGKDLEPTISETSRAGDIRHCWADTTRARDLLGFEAKVTFEEGVKELVAWVKSQQSSSNQEKVLDELAARGLTH